MRFLFISWASPSIAKCMHNSSCPLHVQILCIFFNKQSYSHRETANTLYCRCCLSDLIPTDKSRIFVGSLTICIYLLYLKRPLPIVHPWFGLSCPADNESIYIGRVLTTEISIQVISITNGDQRYQLWFSLYEIVLVHIWHHITYIVVSPNYQVYYDLSGGHNTRSKFRQTMRVRRYITTRFAHQIAAFQLEKQKRWDNSVKCALCIVKCALCIAECALYPP